MWTYHPDLLSRPVPRYTSYPTAADFGEDVGAGDYMRALDAVESGAPLSLYVHIPYCEQICWYCGCNTGATNRKHRLTDYLTALRADISYGLAEARTTYGIIGIKTWIYKGEIFDFSQVGQEKQDDSPRGNDRGDRGDRDRPRGPRRDAR